MASLDKTLLIGNLTRDPELRVTPKGTPICQFSIAINHRYKLESGEQREEVVYLDCECWGRSGENVAKYFQKGTPIFIEGRHKLEQWEDKQTQQKRSRLKIVVEKWQFVQSQGGGGRGDGDGGDQEEERRAPSRGFGGSNAGRGNPQSQQRQEDEDQDVPF